MKTLILSLWAAASVLAATPAMAANTPPDTQPGADGIVLLCTVTDARMSNNCRYYSAITDEEDRLKAGSVLGYLDTHPFPIPGGAIGADVYALVRLNVAERPDHHGYVITAPDDTSKAPSGLEVDDPVWTSSPFGRWAAGFTPDRANRAGIKGEAKALCKVTGSGALTDCWLEREDPKGWGFGEAALRLLTHARMKPQGANGQPVADRPFAITLKFSPDGAIEPCLFDGVERMCKRN